jgi:hypothetical protein
MPIAHEQSIQYDITTQIGIFRGQMRSGISFTVRRALAEFVDFQLNRQK